MVSEKEKAVPEFSENTLAILHQAGWNEGRKVDTTIYEQALRSEGYEVFPTTLDFLSRFGNLEIKYPHHRVPSITAGFSLDLLDALETTSPSTVQAYSKILKTRLTVISRTYDNGLLLMAMDGKVFDVFDAWMVEVGDSGEDAIEALCSGRELKSIPHPRGYQS